MGAHLAALLAHHAERAGRGVAYNALRDCHVAGMASIVLHDEPGNRVRVFVTNGAHGLHWNRPSVWLGAPKHARFSLGVHPHHCDIRLIHLFGEVHNDLYAVVPHRNGPFEKYAFQSAINTGSGSLVPTGTRADLHMVRTDALASKPVAMKAHELHSVYVPNGERAAWMVVEGEEDTGFDSSCWSNTDRTFDFSNLYQPMDAPSVAKVLTTLAERVARGY